MTGGAPPSATDPRLRELSGALRNRSRQAAILCYHSVTADGPPFLSIAPDTFERQLEMLRERGYQSGGLRDLAALAEGIAPRAPLAFLTFDDGYLDNFTRALPLLREYGFGALVFILPTCVDDGAAFRWPEVAGQLAAYGDVMRSLDWPMVEAMAEAGIEFGSHTLTHPHLPELSDEELAHELGESRARIHDRLGSCDSIAYPFGDWDARVAAAAAAAGYRFAFTMPRGAQSAATPLSIPRVAVDQRDAGRRFLLKLTSPGRRLLLSPAKEHLRRLRRRPPCAAR